MASSILAASRVALYCLIMTDKGTSLAITGRSEADTVPPLPSCSPNRVARDPAGVTVPPLPSCSPNRVARDPAGFTVPSIGAEVGGV